MQLLCAKVQGSRCQHVQLVHIVVLQLQFRKRSSDSIAKRSYRGFFYRCRYRLNAEGCVCKCCCGFGSWTAHGWWLRTRGNLYHWSPNLLVFSVKGDLQCNMDVSARLEYYYQWL